MTWLVVVNPNAGGGRDLTESVTVGLAKRGVDAIVTITPSLDDLRREVEAAVGRGITRFAAVGGDGSAHHLVNTVRDADSDMHPTIALVPGGSGGDFVRTFGHSTDLDAALDRIASPDPYPTDIGSIRGQFGVRWFLNAANAGVAAASAARAERLPRQLGGLRYTAAFWLALGTYRASFITATIDRHRFEGEAINVVVANGQFFGGGLNIAPKATVQDGRFDVQVFSGPRRSAFVVMPRLVFGSHLTHRAVRRYVGASIHLDVPDDTPIEADGEILGTGSVSVAMHPAAIDFVL